MGNSKHEGGRPGRDEIRSACEAVGWVWEQEGTGDSADGDENWSFAHDEAGGFCRFSGDCEDFLWNGDAVALLTAWRKMEAGQVRVDLGDGFCSVRLYWPSCRTDALDADLPAAAVRAVNRWSAERGPA